MPRALKGSVKYFRDHWGYQLHDCRAGSVIYVITWPGLSCPYEAIPEKQTSSSEIKHHEQPFKENWILVGCCLVDLVLK
jgi:hypothetical protein